MPNTLRITDNIELGNVAGKITTIASAGGAQTDDYTITLPIGLGVQDSVLSLSAINTGTKTATASFIDHVPSAQAITSGFSAWDVDAAPYWSYAKPAGVPTFTVLKSGYGYCRGKRVNWTAPQSIAISYNENNYIGINSSGVLFRSASGAQPTYYDNIILFELMDDGVMALPFVKKENHPVNFNMSVAHFLHQNLGNIIQGAGGVISPVVVGTGALVTHRQLKITGDTVEDHGISTTFPATSPLPVAYYYKNGGGDWIQVPGGEVTTIPMQYSNAGVLTALPAGDFGIMRVYVTEDDLNTTGANFFAVLQNARYASLANANTAINNGSVIAADNEILSMEPSQLGYVIVRNSGGGYVAEVIIQKNTFNSRYVGGASSSSHLLLGDLDGGQYLTGGHTYVPQRIESAADPTLTDDTDNYRPGALWVNSTTKDLYILADATDSAAKWHGIARFNSTTSSGTRVGCTLGGYQCLKDKTGSTYDVAIGFGSMSGSASSSSYNVAVGYQALLGDTTGGYNVGIGYQAGSAITTGANNICIGRSSVASAAVNDQIAVGYTATTGANGALALGNYTSAGNQ
jgi:hypothetical protein